MLAEVAPTMPLPQFFKCLAEDTRLKILLLLKSHAELCVCDLTLALASSQPKVSRHLAELKKHGLVSDERRGKWIYYRLNTALAPWQESVIALALSNTPDFIHVENTLLNSHLNERCC
ncbi:MAG: ArsR family transcriptional regulator [Zhongshania aliphaticivorans]|jgi:ArsR family transcriptional regulator